MPYEIHLGGGHPDALHNTDRGDLDRVPCFQSAFAADYMGHRRPDRLGESAARRMERPELWTSSGGR